MNTQERLGLIIHDTLDLATEEPNGLMGEFAHLVSEVGELATAVEAMHGSIIKQLSEPADVEAVDVIMCGLSVFAKLNPTLTPSECMQKLATILVAKNQKWERSLLVRLKDL